MIAPPGFTLREIYDSDNPFVQYEVDPKGRLWLMLYGVPQERLQPLIDEIMGEIEKEKAHACV